MLIKVFDYPKNDLDACCPPILFVNSVTLAPLLLLLFAKAAARLVFVDFLSLDWREV